MTNSKSWFKKDSLPETVANSLFKSSLIPHPTQISRPPQFKVKLPHYDWGV